MKGGRDFKTSKDPLQVDTKHRKKVGCYLSTGLKKEVVTGNVFEKKRTFDGKKVWHIKKGERGRQTLYHNPDVSKFSKKVGCAKVPCLSGMTTTELRMGGVHQKRHSLKTGNRPSHLGVPREI